ncbi:hypothetical protein V1511DRAFT_389982 [Dipodascopsis uninucleata]
MPPKFTVPFTVKVKNGTKTIVLLLDPGTALNELKTQLIIAIRDTWTAGDDGDSMLDDMSIPKPSFDTVDNSETQAVSKASEASFSDLSAITINDINVALPVDVADLEKGWREIDNTEDRSMGLKSIEALGIRDGSVLALRLKGQESYDVRIPSFDDEE